MQSNYGSKEKKKKKVRKFGLIKNQPHSQWLSAAWQCTSDVHYTQNKSHGTTELGFRLSWDLCHDKIPILSSRTAKFCEAHLLKIWLFQNKLSHHVYDASKFYS